jgi:hypothetical protein
MATVDENAFTILRLMREKGITSEKEMTVAELKALIGLDDEEFEQADRYLLQLKLVSGTGGGNWGKHWITPEGIEYVSREMDTRLPLSLEGESIIMYTQITSKQLLT